MSLKLMLIQLQSYQTESQKRLIQKRAPVALPELSYVGVLEGSLRCLAAGVDTFGVLLMANPFLQL